MTATETISKNVLTIPELLSRIFEFSTKECIASALCVCTLWADVGKPHVWRELEADDIDGLLSLLVSWTNGMAPELMIPHPVDWQRFLQYSSLVHCLCLTTRVSRERMIKVRAAALNFIAESRPVYDVFPNLQTLVCAADKEEVFRPFLAFLHSGVTHLVLNIPENSDMGGILIPVQRLSNLVYVELYGPSCEFDIDILRPALAVLQQLPSLATVVLPSRSATYPMLEALSKFPALEEIQASIIYGYPCSDRHLTSRSFDSFNCRAFPVLNTLTISGCSYRLSQLLDDTNFPFHIQILTVEVIECSINPVPALQKIATKCSRVTNYTLLDTERVPSPFSLLQPFLTHNITRLRVQAVCPLSYALSEIEELAQSLPRVEYLSLEDLPKPGISSIPPGNYPKLTFDHLPIFARHCRKLSQFEIKLDTTQPCVLSLSDIVPFATLCEINLLLSFVYFRDFPDLDGAATVLSELLPSYCLLTCEETSSSHPSGTAGTAETMMVPADAGKLNALYTKRQSIARWLRRRIYVPQSASDAQCEVDI